MELQYTCLVIYYDGNFTHACLKSFSPEDWELGIQSTTPETFGLPEDYMVTAVIVSPDIDKTVIFAEGEVQYGSIDTALDRF